MNLMMPNIGIYGQELKEKVPKKKQVDEKYKKSQRKKIESKKIV
jgi:hypothetical protein